MDLFDKAGRAVGDVVSKARERERVRLEDRLRLLDSVGSEARQMVHLLKHRAGYTWHTEADEHGLRMLAAAEAIDDDSLRGLVDALYAIEVPYDSDTPDLQRREEATALLAAYRAIVARLGLLRRETLADEG